jgi:dTDP-4-amino-4,6-dideoxygalactose transaminase
VANRRGVYDALRAAGIGVQVHYVPMYSHRVFASPRNGASRFPTTAAVYECLLSLPLFPDLTEAEQDRVVETLATAL